MLPILLVDDSEVARHTVARRLRDEGYTVHEASSAADARRHPVASFACAIVDIDLDDGDGPTLAAELRAAAPALAVAFFSTGASAELVARSRAHGPVFLKPALEPLLEWVHALQPPPTK
jgi:two-component system cell cycle sensor histidine kinase/response regulator CckA